MIQHFYMRLKLEKEKEIFDVNKVVEKWGVGPENIIDCLVLWEIALIMFQASKELVQKQL